MHILLSNRLLVTAISCSLYTVRSFVLRGASHFPMHFINESAWKSSQHYIITSTSYLCFYFIKVMALAPSSVCYSTTATYLSSCSFMYLCVPYYCHACLLRVGVKTLYNKAVTKKRLLFFGQRQFLMEVVVVLLECFFCHRNQGTFSCSFHTFAKFWTMSDLPFSNFFTELVSSGVIVAWTSFCAKKNKLTKFATDKMITNSN